LCHFKDKTQAEASKQLIKFAAGIALESIVDVLGTVAAAEVKSCSQNDVEVAMEKLFVVSRAPVALPFLLEDAARSDAAPGSHLLDVISLPARMRCR
jgi:aspartyl-tRNA synthetase